MPSQAVTGTPTALAGVTTGTFYTIQNLGEFGIVHVLTADSAPDASDAANILTELRTEQNTASFKADSGESIWIWGDAPSVFYDKAE